MPMVSRPCATKAGARTDASFAEGALIDLGIDRNDPLTELIAKAIVNVTATGERNAPIVKERALNALGVRPRAA
jgi:hypothetical protein